MLKTASLCVAVSSLVKYLRVRQFAFSGVLLGCLAWPALGETGKASWYGNQHHGQRTASGESFDQNAMTAAHRTLPFGSKVKVCTKVRCVTVRINDRGPARWTHRVIDLAREPARQLGILKRGVVKVRVERVR